MRFRSKPLAALSIILVLTGALGAWHEPDDRDDDSGLVVHQHSEHDARFAGPAHRVTQQEHCAFCHWLRSFGNGAPVATQLLSASSLRVALTRTLVAHVLTADRLSLPSRAPPLG